MVYNIGKWTPSTLETLKFLKSKNELGEKPKLKDLPSGTFRNWIYPLKDAGYISNGDGFELREKGIQLFKELQKNPPIDRRGRNKSLNLSLNEMAEKIIEDVKLNGKLEVNVKGKDLFFQASITSDEANQIIKYISEIKMKR